MLPVEDTQRNIRAKFPYQGMFWGVCIFNGGRLSVEKNHVKQRNIVNLTQSGGFLQDFLQMNA